MLTFVHIEGIPQLTCQYQAQGTPWRFIIKPIHILDLSLNLTWKSYNIRAVSVWAGRIIQHSSNFDGSIKLAITRSSHFRILRSPNFKVHKLKKFQWKAIQILPLVHSIHIKQSIHTKLNRYSADGDTSTAINHGGHIRPHQGNM